MLAAMRFGGRKHELITYRDRVEAFWDWFSSQARRFYETIEAGQCNDLTPEVSEKVDEFLGNLAWVFGPGPQGVGGHSFTLSPEGNVHRQFLTTYWHELAPKVPGWTFYPARQPGPMTDMAIQIGGHSFAADEVMAAVEPDFENKRVNLQIWHPKLHLLTTDNAANTLVFLFLDEALGEQGTECWVGLVQLSQGPLENALPMTGLGTHIRALSAVHHWPLLGPDEKWVVYHAREPNSLIPRSDIIAGITCNQKLVFDYREADGEMEDPLDGSGAHFAFVQFPVTILPSGNEAEHRGSIEDSFNRVLMDAHSGRAIGGGTGSGFAYIDLVLYDGGRSIQLVLRTMKEMGMPKGSSLQFFGRSQWDKAVTL